MIDHWLTFGTALMAFFTSVIGFGVLFRKVKEVHILVNSNLTKVMGLLSVQTERSAQLKDSLKDAGVAVPPKPTEKELH